MTKEEIIRKTVQILIMLPKEKADEICDFADLVLKKYEYQTLQRGIEALESDSEAFALVKNEEDLYSLNERNEQN